MLFFIKHGFYSSNMGHFMKYMVIFDQTLFFHKHSALSADNIPQNIPRLFRSAENIGISSVLIISTAVVCVYVIHVCWQTKNSAEKTGVFMHKLANIVDENHFYEIVSATTNEPPELIHIYYGHNNLIWPKCRNLWCITANSTPAWMTFHNK